MTAFARSLIHRARAIRTEDVASSDFQQGEPMSSEGVPRPWFPARLLPGAGREVAGPVTVEERRATLIYAGDEIRGSDRVEVETDAGTTEWIVTAPPRPLERGRRVAGWRADLARSAP